MSVKLILLLKRRADLSEAAFGDAWRAAAQRHASAGAAAPVRHVHNRALGGDMPIENAPAADFDGVDELWFADAAALTGWLASEAAGDRWLRDAGELLAEPPRAIAGEPQVIWQQGGLAPDPIKIITLPVRRAGLSQAAFSDHWIKTHSALALQGPRTRERLRRLEVCPSGVPLPASLLAAAFDGAGAIEFGRRADLAAEFESDHYRTVLAPDEPRFTDPQRSSAIMVEPVPIAG
jgi:hypothetical protein